VARVQTLHEDVRAVATVGLDRCRGTCIAMPTPTMNQRISITTAILVAALAGAGGFALGRSTSSPPAHAEPISAAPIEPMNDMAGGGGGNDLPPGHPNVGNTMGGGSMGGGHAGMGSSMGSGGDLPPAGEATITWTAPARWKSVPNPSTMRLATYKIPHAPSDTEDPELSVTQVGGGVDANIDRWIGQFDEQGQKTAKKNTKTVKGLPVTFVQLEGTFSGGMGAGGGKGYALLGAIVETPGMPHFFKMTGPAASVKAARAELEQMIDTINPK
jgi:hypothetical protein